MAANRNVNKVILMGNLTKDPVVRYTPQGTAVANFTVATNRSWTVNGEQKEAVDFHNVVAWNKLAEICGQLLGKGTMVYIEGRLHTREWTSEEGKRNYRTEVNAEEMIVVKNPKNASGTDDSDVAYSSNEGGNESSHEDVDIDKLLEEIDSES